VNVRDLSVGDVLNGGDPQEVLAEKQPGTHGKRAGGEQQEPHGEAAGGAGIAAVEKLQVVDHDRLRFRLSWLAGLRTAADQSQNL